MLETCHSLSMFILSDQNRSGLGRETFKNGLKHPSNPHWMRRFEVAGDSCPPLARREAAKPAISQVVSSSRNVESTS
jgi:hypothetical protein